MNYFLKLLEKTKSLGDNRDKSNKNSRFFAYISDTEIVKKYFDRMIRAVFARGKMEASVSSFLLSLFSVFYYALYILSADRFFGVNMSSVAAFLGVSGLFFDWCLKKL